MYQSSWGTPRPLWICPVFKMCKRGAFSRFHHAWRCIWWIPRGGGGRGGMLSLRCLSTLEYITKETCLAPSLIPFRKQVKASLFKGVILIFNQLRLQLSALKGRLFLICLWSVMVFSLLILFCFYINNVQHGKRICSVNEVVHKLHYGCCYWSIHNWELGSCFAKHSKGQCFVVEPDFAKQFSLATIF